MVVLEGILSWHIEFDGFIFVTLNGTGQFGLYKYQGQRCESEEMISKPEGSFFFFFFKSPVLSPANLKRKKWGEKGFCNPLEGQNY